MHPLSVAGTGFEILGIAVGIAGFYGVSRKAGEYPWSGLVRKSREQAARIRARLQVNWDRLTRRRTHVVVSPDPISLNISMGRPTIRTGFAPLRRHWDHEARLHELADRTNELRTKIEVTADRLQAEDERLAKRLQSIEARLDSEVQRLEGERRAEDMRDSRLQFGGLLFVVLGIVLNAWGQALAA